MRLLLFKWKKLNKDSGDKIHRQGPKHYFFFLGAGLAAGFLTAGFLAGFFIFTPC
jgi:hypothetical protein